ncbi:autophagy-related protein [Lasiosphaeria ovina]|uniref:Autophagy-related protein 101 n=1 Tax=Lasiosphaeria ovina TaxID=92902 RepID=A0AAE0KN77_9PEZI|nr:autophagy-related protein [Lasiosphaeria ovina]
MEQRGAPEFILEAFADPNSARDVLRGVLHTIFFLRFFPSVLPQTRDVIGLELAYVPEAEIETLIDQRVGSLVRQLETERNQPHTHNHPHSMGGAGAGGGGGGGGSGGGPGHQVTASSSGSGRGQITVSFFEKKRRKAWYDVRGGDEVCWESWTVKVTIAEPRTEGERAKVRKAMESTLHNTIMKAVTLANTHKDHIPPIMTTESNPFPYQITVNHQKDPGWASRMGIY